MFSPEHGAPRPLRSPPYGATRQVGAPRRDVGLDPAAPSLPVRRRCRRYPERH